MFKCCFLSRHFKGHCEKLTMSGRICSNRNFKDLEFRLIKSNDNMRQNVAFKGVS